MDIEYLTSRLNGQTIETNYKLNRDKNNIVVSAIPINNTNKWKVTWMIDGSTTEELSENISDYTKYISETVNKHNSTIDQETYNNNPVNSLSGTIYTRTSCSSGIRESVQRDICLNWAKNNNIKLSSPGYIKDDGVSGYKGKNFRTGEIGFWKDYLKPNSILIVTSIDRFSRSILAGLKVLNELSNLNIQVHFVQENITWNKDITSALKSQVITQLNIAEMESDKKSEKLKNSIRIRKQRGNHIGRVGYGYKKIKQGNIMKKVVNQDEYKVINYMKNKYNLMKGLKISDYQKYLHIIKKDCKISLYKHISKCLEIEGYYNRQGKKFTQSMIKKMINS